MTNRLAARLKTSERRKQPPSRGQRARYLFRGMMLGAAVLILLDQLVGSKAVLRDAGDAFSLGISAESTPPVISLGTSIHVSQRALVEYLDKVGEMWRD